MLTLFTLFLWSDGFNAISPTERKWVFEQKHVGSVSDSLGRLSAASECMASVKKLDI